MSRDLRNAARITAVTLASRILGLCRDVMMFRMLGFSWAIGAFALAWMVPNLLRRLFGEGALSASFIPAYTRIRQEQGEPAGRRLLSSVTGLLLVVLGGLSAVVVLVCTVLPADWIGQASQQQDGPVSAHRFGALLLDLTIILFPYAIPICLAAVFAGALNTHGRFALPASAPIVLNLFWIAGLLWAWERGLEDPADVVTLVAACLLAGGAAQLALSLVPLARGGHLEPPRLPGPGDPAREVLKNVMPTVAGMSLAQINTMMDQGFAVFIAQDGPSFIYAANRLLLFPHALTGLALATATFPSFARLGAARDLPGLRAAVDTATRQTLFIALPAAVGMMLVAEPLITLMFESDKSTPDDFVNASRTTMCLVASLPMIGVAQLHARALYALDDFRTPAWMSLWLLLLNLLLNVVLALGLGLGVPGLALATTLASVVNAIGLRRKVLARCPDAGAPSLGLWPTLGASAAMGAVVFGLLAAIPAGTRTERALYDLALPVLGGVAVYGLLRLRTLRRARAT